MLLAIRGGVKLKKPEKKRAEEPQISMKATGVAAILARRIAIMGANEDESSDSSDDSDEDWD